MFNAVWCYMNGRTGCMRLYKCMHGYGFHINNDDNNSNTFIAVHCHVGTIGRTRPGRTGPPSPRPEPRMAFDLPTLLIFGGRGRRRRCLDARRSSTAWTTTNDTISTTSWQWPVLFYNATQMGWTICWRLWKASGWTAREWILGEMVAPRDLQRLR